LCLDETIFVVQL